MSPSDDHQPKSDEATNAIIDADRGYRSGTAQAALRNRDFRFVWGGTFASNIGTWMQNVLLGAFTYRLTHDVGYVGLVYFAQLGPLLFLAPVGGLIADVVDRRRYLVMMQMIQLILSLGLAGIAAADKPNETAVFLCVLAIGIANALSAPALGAILPTLVPREDLPGAVSLQSVQMNLSRVIGPAIGAPLYAVFGAAMVFAINALTYLFAVAGLLIAHYNARPSSHLSGGPLKKVMSGFSIAKSDPLIRRILITMTVLSLFSLTFIGLMPEIAQSDLGIPPKSIYYGFLYALFGLGAALGAITVGTFLAHHSKALVARHALVIFSVLLAWFALIRNQYLAYAVVFLLGFAYFLVITSLSTVLQDHLDDANRGRVTALWIMSFGGTVPVGVLLAGYLVENLITITAVVLFGAAVAIALGAYCDLRRDGAQ